MKITEYVRRLWKPSLVVFGVMFFSAYLFSIAQHKSIFISMWWALVTITTVGYGDYVPNTPLGYFAGVILLMFIIVFGGYFLNMFTSMAVEAERDRNLGLDGTKMKDHMVVCGWSDASKSAIQEMIANNLKIAVVVEDEKAISEVNRLGTKDQIFACYADPSTEEAYELVNMKYAHGVIVSTNNDVQNVVISSKLVGYVPKTTRIIVVVKEEQLKKSISLGGISYIISPYTLAGRFASSASFKPDVEKLMEDLSTSTYGIDMFEYKIGEDSPLLNLTVSKAYLLVWEKMHAILIGIAKRENGVWTQTGLPDDSTVFTLNSYAIIIGKSSLEREISKWMKQTNQRLRE